MFNKLYKQFQMENEQNQSQAKECIINLHKAMEQAANHPQQAIQEKYKQAKYDQVALIEPPKSLASCIHN